MKIRFTRWNWRFYFALERLHPTKGVNSLLPGRKHIILWDFDNQKWDDVVANLIKVQSKYKLSNIYILNTGVGGYYHAYCFQSHDFYEVLKVLADTQIVDKGFFALGLYREFFTLRYSPKKDREFSKAIVLPSRYKEDVNPYFLKYGCTYLSRKQ